jgi:norsolorinic acid ketoreductase
MSSPAGSITYQPVLPFDITPYGASKAASNLLLRKIHAEHEDLIAFSVHPGWVKTEMGNWAAQNAKARMEEAPEGLEEGVRGSVKVIDEATREGTSGGFWKYDGSVVPW